MKTRLYTHTPLNQEIAAAAGHYVIQEEKRVSFKGRELLVARGYMVIDSSCCGTGGCGFAYVAGYLVGWETERNEKGEAVSEVEPVRDEKERDAVRSWIRQNEGVLQVQFG
ncbi:MAG: hypothetical protein AB1640_24920 [bacterium]